MQIKQYWERDLTVTFTDVLLSINYECVSIEINVIIIIIIKKGQQCKAGRE